VRAFLANSLVALGLLSGCSRGAELSQPSAKQPAPPVATRIPHELVAHGDTRVDDYYWLRERDNPEVIAYLEAENGYTEAATAPLAPLRAELYDEMVGRVVQDETSEPYRDRDYFYYTRFVEGGEYPIHCRKRGSLDANEEIILDADALGRGQAFFAIYELELSESQQLLAYGVDTVGRRFYTIHFRDLRTGETLADEIPATTGSIEWAADDRSLLYVKQDPETLRPDRVFRHTLGEDPSQDVLVYEEPDDTYEVDIGRSKSREYLIFDITSTLSDEVRLLAADDPAGVPRVFAPRKRGLEYGVDHLGDYFYVRTNLDAHNFRLMRAPVAHTDKQHWQELVGHREDVLLEDFELFDEHIVLEQRRAGLVELEVLSRAGGEGRLIEFAEPAYAVWTRDNFEPATTKLRYVYESLTTPRSVYEYDMVSREATLLDRKKVLGGFDSSNYVSARLDAPARDGVRVPISLVHRRDTPIDGSSPLLLYGYGAYGWSTEADFSPSVLSLLDRGFVFAIAHIRGGDELGRSWYEDGKLLHKRNTFNDFIDCAEFLVARGYADPEAVFAMGGSAGGLLIGAVINMRPELFAGAIAAVPFVDVVTDMLDDSIPLTTVEYDEWGDPHDAEYYEYMLSYSPYDNVRAQAYPALLVTAGLHDSQVQYWEPAKWVAKLRATKTDHNELLLRTDMSAGHSGKSGRLAHYELTAFEFAFLLDLARRSSTRRSKTAVAPQAW
jgi:oligopeptidase B